MHEVREPVGTSTVDGPGLHLRAEFPDAFRVRPGVTVAVDLNRLVRLDFATGEEKNEDLASADGGRPQVSVFG
jgi:hypothetical protein